MKLESNFSVKPLHDRLINLIQAVYLFLTPLLSIFIKMKKIFCLNMQELVNLFPPIQSQLSITCECFKNEINKRIEGET